MGGVLLTEGRMKGERERHFLDVSRFSPRELEKPSVWRENKNIHFEGYFN